MKMTYTKLAEEIARQAHDGQFRRDGITPYIEHPKAVAEILQNAGRPDEVIATAWLHDVLEDTWVTVEDLAHADVHINIIEAVKMLTKPEGINYEKYICGLTTNYIASEVKCADILHNLSDAPSKEQVAKYTKALKILFFNR